MSALVQIDNRESIFWDCYFQIVGFGIVGFGIVMINFHTGDIDPFSFMPTNTCSRLYKVAHIACNVYHRLKKSFFFVHYRRLTKDIYAQIIAYYLKTHWLRDLLYLTRFLAGFLSLYLYLPRYKYVFVSRS